MIARGEKAALAVFVAVAVAGCLREPPRVEVTVCGDVGIPDEIDAVRVSLLDADRAEVASGVRELVRCPEDELRPLPQVFDFQPVDLVNAWVVVQGLEGDVERVRFERRASLSSDQVELIKMGLTRTCVGIQCPLGQTCVGGECELAPEAEFEGICGAPPVTLEDMAAAQDMSAPPAGDMGEVDAGPPAPKYCPPEDDMGGLF